jgi:hypothetical protein
MRPLRLSTLFGALTLFTLSACFGPVARPIADARKAAAERLGCDDFTLRRLATAPYDDPAHTVYEASGCGRQALFTCAHGACRPLQQRPYLPPRADEAVAFVRVWSRYDGEGAASAMSLSESIQIGDAALSREVQAPGPEVARGLVVRARPEVWRVSATPLRHETFHDTHIETHTTLQSCPTGRGWGLCAASASVPVLNTAVRDVASGVCRTEFELSPRAGASYRILYRFRGSDACTVECAEEAPTASGGTTLAACDSFRVRYAEGSAAAL